MAGLGAGCLVRPVSNGLLGTLVRCIGDLRREVMVAILFDAEGLLLTQHTGVPGDRTSVSGRYRPLLARVFEVGAAGFVLVHNHPSGISSPSGADIAATRRLSAIARALDVEFHDHLIVGGRSVVSLRRAGLMSGAFKRSTA